MWVVMQTVQPAICSYVDICSARVCCVVQLAAQVKEFNWKVSGDIATMAKSELRQWSHTHTHTQTRTYSHRYHPWRCMWCLHSTHDRGCVCALHELRVHVAVMNKHVYGSI